MDASADEPSASRHRPTRRGRRARRVLPLDVTPAADSGLADFLLARINDDERKAVLATGGANEKADRWQATDARDWRTDVRDDTGKAVARCSAGVARHVAAWDPRHVLAECAAKRQIVERWRDNGEKPDDPLAFAVACLATPYSADPAYRAEWRPSPGRTS